MNKSVCNIGINDIKGSSKEKYYRVWHNMIQRCYDEKYIIKFPTYKYVYVCKKWHTLSNFRDWFDIHYIDGYVLDKDIYMPDNKVYSPETCLFIPHNINQLINRQHGKGYRLAPSGKYEVYISINGNNKYLGAYDTKKEAHQVYVEYKAKRYIEMADEYIEIDPKICLGLHRHAEKLLGNNWKNLPIGI